MGYFNMADDEDREEISPEVKVKKNTPGIVYISRLPPFMKPAKVRHYFTQFGEIGRLFMQPEDPLVRKKRKKFGGSGRKKFTEGWIEFKLKKIAKSVALSLNNTPIGGKKGSYYHDDIWNIKYLPKFKWSHLSERMAYEKAMRDQRMRTEISQAKREANFYLESVDQQKAKKAITERKRKRQEKEGAIEEQEPLNKQPFGKPKERKGGYGESKKRDSKITKTLLSKVFTSKKS